MNTNKKLDDAGLQRLVNNIKNYSYSKGEVNGIVTPIEEAYIRSLFTGEGNPEDPTPPAVVNTYTKQESDDKFATKVELESVKQSGSSIKQSLVDKLTSVGVPNMSTNNTFAELISNIPAGGKKYTTGTSTASKGSSNFTYEDNTATTMYYIDIPTNTIPFVPSLIMTRATYGTIEYITTYINQPYLISNVLQTTYGKNTSTSASLRYKIDSNVNQTDCYRIPVGGSDMNHIWIAYE